MVTLKNKIIDRYYFVINPYKFNPRFVVGFLNKCDAEKFRREKISFFVRRGRVEDYVIFELKIKN